MSINPGRLTPSLSLDRVVKRFGGLAAVDDLSLDVDTERIVGIIGPNGSGKSTLCNLMTGIAPATSGTVMMGQTDITRMRPHTIFQHGLSRTFQNTRLFGQLTVVENMTIAAQGHRLGVHAAEGHLRDMGLADLSSYRCDQLSYGDQKLVELAMCLLGKTHTAILDEPLAGVHESVVSKIREVILAKSRDVRMIIVEHNVAFMMQVCERIIVMDHGKIIADGVPAVVRNDPAVIDAYFGTNAQNEEVETNA